MKVVEYRDREIAPGFKILHHGQALTVELVCWRRGLELFTRRDDGYCGPVIYPHPDEPIKVIYAPPREALPEYLHTSDYPYAEVKR